MKAISEGSLAGSLVHLDAGSATVWPNKTNKTFKFLSMLITGQYPAGFLMLIHLEIDSPPVALMIFWSYLLKNKSPITAHLHHLSCRSSACQYGD